jgi:precorrin-6y C5,15-methyltransferase (decarboxylating) CbiE subunit
MISGILSGKDIFTSYDPGRITEYIKGKKPEKVCLLYSGDVGFFSGAAGISDLPEDYRLKIIPGISSGIYICDKLMIPWQDVRFVSCHGRRPDLVLEIENNEKLLILLGREDDFGRICRILCKSGHEGSEVYAGERLSYDDEKISSGYAGEMKDISLRLPAVMLIIKH